jgi:outer membrane protein assembly factor BamB
VPFSGDGPLSLSFTATNLVVAGSQIATEARALDDGRVIWTSPRRIEAAPVVADNLVIAPADGQLVALDAATGRDVWTAAIAGVVQPPVLAGDAVLVAAGTTLTCRRAIDGAPLWAANLGARVVTAPASDGGLVIVALDDRSLAAFDRQSGRPVWREPTERTVLAIAVVGDRLFASVAEGLACAYKLEHGGEDWCFPVRVRPIGAPVGDARQVYFAFLDNMVHVFDRRSGRRYFTPSLDALPAAGPTLTADYLVVPVVTGEFVLLSRRDRLQPSRVSTPRAVELPSTRAAAVAADGSGLTMVTTSAGARYSLVYFNRKAPDEPKQADDPKESAGSPGVDAKEQSDGTASGTPPAPRAP